MNVFTSPKKVTGDFLWIYYETRPEIVHRLVPPPLKPIDRPLVVAYAANLKKMTYASPSYESALWIAVDYKGEIGFYAIAMTVTDDMVLIGGRDQMGYPKKMATISYEELGNSIKVTNTRHGITFAEMQAALDGNPNDASFPSVVDTFLRQKKSINFQYKPFPEPNSDFTKLHVNLLRIFLKFKLETSEIGSGQLKFAPSMFDPWSEIEVVKVLGAARSRGEIEFKDVEAKEEVPAFDILPYTMSKNDALPAYYLEKYKQN